MAASSWKRRLILGAASGALATGALLTSAVAASAAPAPQGATIASWDHDHCRHDCGDWRWDRDRDCWDRWNSDRDCWDRWNDEDHCWEHWDHDHHCWTR